MVDSVHLNSRLKTHAADLPLAYDYRRPSGSIRCLPADFKVKELLNFEPSGEGEHLFLYIEKIDCNTDWLARQLQCHFNLRSQAIGYAGKKDKHSIATQWFSVHLPGKKVSLAALNTLLSKYSCRLLKSARHNKKLRKGCIKCNHFKLIVRHLSGPISVRAVEKIKQQGVPNYFGYQRFGHNGTNLVKAQLLFKEKIRVRSRLKRSLYLSAARAYLFNLMLAERIKLGSWCLAVEGDCVNLNTSRAYFVGKNVDAAIQQRIQEGDLHVSGWLPGRQESESVGEALAIELRILNEYRLWLKGLARARLDSARRPMRVFPENFSVQEVDDKQAILRFALPAGSFATALLRELLSVSDDALTNLR